MPPSPTEQHAPSGLGAVSGHSDSASMSPEFIEYVEAMGQNIAYLREQMGEMRDELAALSGQGSDSQRVFDALHQELNDYKRDFIYEHMKPLLRPLLFLNDSLEGLDQEMALFEEAQQGVDLGPAAISATKMRQNVAFLRDQLVEALTVCDLEPMNAPVGAFDPKTQKAVDTEVVPPELDGTIVRVIRNGWLMRGHLFRPTEVVLGKSAAS